MTDPQALNQAWQRWLADQAQEPQEDDDVIDLRESA
jgi:hypothetical protein